MSIGGDCSVIGCNLRHVYKSDMCFKHTRISREEGSKTRAGEQAPWWEDGNASEEDKEKERAIDVGELDIVLCDDDPGLHYGVCEFDNYDGICFHCKNLVHPDLHLIHLIHNDRNLFLNFERSLTEGEKWGGHYRSKVSDIWEEFEERDIMFEAQLGHGASRAKTVQELCYADKEYVLSMLKESLSKAGAPTEGEGTETWVWNSLEAELEGHFERIRTWDIARVDWSPEDWHLEGPSGGGIVGSVDGDTKMHPVGWIFGAGYLWHVFQYVMDTEGAGLELMATEIGLIIALAPLWLINKVFQVQINDEEEGGAEEKPESPGESETRLSQTRKQLTVSTIALLAGFLLPWGWDGMGGTINGLEELRWAPSNLSFWLGDGREFIQWMTTWEWLSMVIRSILPIVFLLTFASTWYMHLQGNDGFSRVASGIHICLFGTWYALVFLTWGAMLPSLEYDIGLYIAGISGIGLDATTGGMISKYFKQYK